MDQYIKSETKYVEHETRNIKSNVGAKWYSPPTDSISPVSDYALSYSTLPDFSSEMATPLYDPEIAYDMNCTSDYNNIPRPPSNSVSTSSSSDGSNDDDRRITKKIKKIYLCPYCQKTFTRPSVLKTHEYTHTSEKPFRCQSPGCNKAFSVVSNLRRHFKVHRKSNNNNKMSSDDRKRRVEELMALTDGLAPDHFAHCAPNNSIYHIQSEMPRPINFGMYPPLLPKLIESPVSNIYPPPYDYASPYEDISQIVHTPRQLLDYIPYQPNQKWSMINTSHIYTGGQVLDHSSEHFSLSKLNYLEHA